MEEPRPQKRRPIAQCSCGALISAIDVNRHLVQGHSIHPLPQKIKIEEILSMISKKEEEANTLKEAIISKVNKVISNQLKKFRELRKKADDLYDAENDAIELFKNKVNAVGSSKKSFKELGNLMQKLGFELPIKPVYPGNSMKAKLGC